MFSPEDISVRHFSTFPHGGAALAALRLHQGLENYGLDSQFLYHRNEHPEEPVEINNARHLTFDKKGHLKDDDGHDLDWLSHRLARTKEKQVHRLFQRHLTDRPPGFDTYAMARLPYPTPFADALSESDIIQLHWVSFFLDYPTFFASIPDRTPIIWNLHDMNAFTGGCHFAGSCERFKSGCSSCPQIQRPGVKDVSRDSFQAKQTALKDKNVHVVAPSDWLLNKARQSAIWPESTKFHTIHYGLDLKNFHPLDSFSARKALNLPTHKKLIAFGAADVNNARKGFLYLAKALALIQSAYPDQIECLVFGTGEIKESSQLPKIHRLGFIDSQEQLRKVYSAADIVVVPSLDDNQPQTGLEAMACETPVVAFDAGGIPEFVRHEQTGLLAKKMDSRDLAKQIFRLIKDSELRLRLGTAARKMVEMEFETKSQTWRYLKLYRSILKPTSEAEPAGTQSVETRENGAVAKRAA